MRDVASFFRNDTSGENPLAGAIQKAIMYGVSQTGRTVRTFLDLGVNEDEEDQGPVGEPLRLCRVPGRE